MKVCNHNGILIAVFTRDEHCPPHLHVGNDEWDARYEFAYWHGGVRLMDVTPQARTPKSAVLEDFRNVIKDPRHLRKARELWWSAHGSLCLDNKWWDPDHELVVDPKKATNNARAIASAKFDPRRYCTILHLAGTSEPLEISL